MARDRNLNFFVEMLLLVLLGVLWGMPYALTKIALVSIPATTMVAARVSLAALSLWILVLATGQKLPRDRYTVMRLCVQGLIGCAVPYVLIAIGQTTVESAVASILNSTGPLFVCAIGLLLPGREMPSLGRSVGITLGLGGVVIVTGIGTNGGFGHATFGQGAILVATLSSAVAAIHARRFISIAPEVVAAATLTSAAIFLIPAAVVLDPPVTHVPPLSAMIALIVNAILATALGFVVYFRLIRTLGAIGTVSVGYLRPAIGVLIGCVLLGERLTSAAVGGLVVILIGVTFINLDTTPWRLQRVMARLRRLWPNPPVQSSSGTSS